MRRPYLFKVDKKEAKYMVLLSLDLWEWQLCVANDNFMQIDGNSKNLDDKFSWQAYNSAWFFPFKQKCVKRTIFLFFFFLQLLTFLIADYFSVVQKNNQPR